MQQKKSRKRRSGLAAYIVLGSILLIIAAAYLVMVNHYTNRFLPESNLNGMDVSGMKPEEVKKDIQASIMSYQLTIKKLDGQEEVITSKDMGREYADDHKVEELIDSQNQWLWFEALFSNERYEMTAGAVYDENLLKASVDGLDCFKPALVTAPEDAYIQEDVTGYRIVPEVEGNTLDKEKVMKAVKEAVDAGKTEIDLAALECYIKPEVYRDDARLNSQVESLNRLTSANVYYDFGDERIEIIGRDMIKEWLVEDGDIYRLNDTSVYNYVAALAEKYDTYAMEREFTTHDGRTIKLNNGENTGVYKGEYRGDYGWVMNQEETAMGLIEAINAGQTGQIEPVWLYEAMRLGIDDIGGTYVEISIEEQKMWCYQDYKVVVETPVVTGNPNTGHATPQGGCWAIDAKITDTFLVGEDYRAPVKFWLPFDSPNDVGIHDLERSEFGGTVYQSNGSHGCVNTPYDAVEQIFNIVSVGTAVIVY